MIFGDLPLAEAEGAILAHSVREGGLSFKKGRVLTAGDIAALRAANIRTVTGAKLGPDDIHEDEAAERLARAMIGDGLEAAAPFTGRVNLYATRPGLCVVDRERLDRINKVDESITVATLDQYAMVDPGRMAATIKIIPFAAPRGDLALCEAVAAQRDLGPVVRVAPFRRRKVGLIQTRQPSTSAKMLDKTVAVTNARVTALEGVMAPDRRCAHNAKTLAGEIRHQIANGVELLLIAGASAITDRRDVLPAAVEAAGGEVEHFGMPVDPGNLLLLARLGGTVILGLPGCARSPKPNGFDWVLRRVMADVPVTRGDIMAMGVGGLLMEIPTRPQPRHGETEDAGVRAPRIAAIVLAAGRSTRMGADNKLLTPIDGAPMVVKAVDAALASQAAPVIVVTGHEAEDVAAALGGRDITIVQSPLYAEGLSRSLKVGLSAMPPDSDGVLVCLGDMPRITAAHLNRLIAAYNPAEGRAIVVPTFNGKRGNPVLWDRRFLAEMGELAGDVGARHMIGAYEDLAVETPMPDDSVLLDVDTPDALAALNVPEPREAS